MIQQLYGLHISPTKRLMWEIRYTNLSVVLKVKSREKIPEIFNLSRMSAEAHYDKLNKIKLRDFYLGKELIFLRL